MVTDGEQRSSLAVVRSLGRAGYDVAVCSSYRRPLAGASRYCRIAHRVTDPLVDAEGFSRDLISLIDAEGVELVLPMTDVTAPLVLDLRTSRPEVMVPFPEARSYEHVTDKRRLIEAASELGVPVPKSRVISAPGGGRSSDLAVAASKELGWPVILKPARSAVRAGRGTQKLSVSTVAAPDQLELALARYPDHAYPILVQERIVGAGLGAFFASGPDGRILGCFAHRRLREKPPTGGVSVYRESVPMRADVLEYSRRILQRFKWYGAVMLEFKQDADTGTPYLMEANARFWGSLQLAIDSGVDFPRLLVESARGLEVEPVLSYRHGIRSRWLWGDFDHLLWMLRRSGRERRLHPTLPSRWRALGRFLVPWRPGDRLEVLRPGDPGPFLRESAGWVKSLRSDRGRMRS